MTTPRATIMTTPRATMRLQLHKGFTFGDAARLAPYMARLGVSHLYASPILTARAGSMHGYDVVDPTRVNPELGGEDGFRRMVAALRTEHLGLIVDIVPNHMAIGAENPWWQDVLRRGHASVHADVFDIDWHPENPLLDGKVLLPVLGKPYGEALDDISLVHGAGHVDARYFDNLFPIRPDDEAEIGALGLAAYDPADAAGRARLHRLLERQHYRLAFWRVAGDEINWRRFFDINELAGVRVEAPRVFEATHATLFRLYAEGLIDGVRIDHVDGLADPRSYCRRLRGRLAELTRQPAYLIVEKILGEGESLAADWQVDGTSGYDFMNEVSAVQHDPNAAPALASLWASLSGRGANFEPEEVSARRETLDRGFDGQLEACVGALHRVARSSLATRDVSRAAIRRAVVALLAHFPAYRGYATDEQRPAGDQAVFARALEGANTERGSAQPEVMALLVDWLTAPDDALRQAAATRFQQLSAPIAAKAVEDTAFYRYGRLLSRNDVGFDAARLGARAAEFHRRMHARRTQFPDAMLATATHDHKRGEDARARLAVLSECPDAWGAALRGWIDRNARHRTQPDAPSAGDEVMLYQMIVGAWPMALAAADRAGRRAFAERLGNWQEKAQREAKLRTNWTAPDTVYEAAARAFLDAAMDDDGFAAAAAAFADRIGPAGAVNGLAQAVLKLTAPGIPDLYQGTEFWDQSLVDPDNRREVDFDARVAALAASEAPPELVLDWRDGRVKQRVIARVLDVRRRLPDLFARGDYVALAADGPRAGHVVAFARRHGETMLMVVVPRLPLALMDGHGLAIPPAAWVGTALATPSWLDGRTLHDVIGGAEHRMAQSVAVGEVLARFPVAVLAAS
ncbi:MAG: malto-oligosyltrehalose synthase [Acetobacteraceae bacterium]